MRDATDTDSAILAPPARDQVGGYPIIGAFRAQLLGFVLASIQPDSWARAHDTGRTYALVTLPSGERVAIAAGDLPVGLGVAWQPPTYSGPVEPSSGLPGAPSAFERQSFGDDLASSARELPDTLGRVVGAVVGGAAGVIARAGEAAGIPIVKAGASVLAGFLATPTGALVGLGVVGFLLYKVTR